MDDGLIEGRVEHEKDVLQHPTVSVREDGLLRWARELLWLLQPLSIPRSGLPLAADVSTPSLGSEERSRLLSFALVR